MTSQLLSRVLILLALSTTGAANANTQAIDTESDLTMPERIGSADLSWFGLKLYTADLYTERGAEFDWSDPFRLDLTYSREFSSAALVKATLVELERTEGARADHAEIEEGLALCFRQVAKGDVFSAMALEQNSVRLFLNGIETCTLEHEDIRRRFLGIWLSDQSRELAASRALRGLNQ